MCVQDGGVGGAGGEPMKIWVPDKDELWQLARIVRRVAEGGRDVRPPDRRDGEGPRAARTRADAARGEVEVACEVTQPWDETHGEA